MKQEQFNQENQQIGQLLTAFLKSNTNQSVSDKHLDEDLISAFVDGSLSQRESEPVLKHLVGCSPCRKITAQLARLAEELNEQPEPLPIAAAQPNRLQKFLTSLGLSSFGLSDEAVFAHNESSEENKAEDEDQTDSEAEENQDSNK